MTCRVKGPVKWSMTRDDKGYRTYKLLTLVESDNSNDGPGTVMLTPGLPVVGAFWALGNDIDPWCWCRWEASYTPVSDKEPNFVWLVENTFSNKPNDRPNDNPNDNPLLEPPKISGDYLKQVVEITHDRFGKPAVYSSFEKIQGQKAEFDETKGTIRIEQNFPFLNFTLNEYCNNAVNDRPLWGLPARCIKLSGIKWERLYYGSNQVYYKRTLDFETDRKGWDRLVLDEGTKVLNGRWTAAGQWELVNIDGEPPDPNNPSHFMAAKDRKGNTCKMILNGRGLPAEVSVTSAGDLALIGTWYLSIVDNNLNHPLLANTDFWIPWIDNFGAWQSNVAYEPGSVVTHVGSYWINTETSTPGLAPPNFKWVEIADADGLEFQGDWLATTTYHIGSAVTYPPSVPEAIGQIPLSKYPGVNFLMLDVPLFF